MEASPTGESRAIVAPEDRSSATADGARRAKDWAGKEMTA
jgi:hypothetical protein